MLQRRRTTAPVTARLPVAAPGAAGAGGLRAAVARGRDGAGRRPGTPQRAEQEAAIAALDEQRDLRLRRRDAQRAELASLQDGVSTATRTPLPDDGEATAKVTRTSARWSATAGPHPPDPIRGLRRGRRVVAGRRGIEGRQAPRRGGHQRAAGIRGPARRERRAAGGEGERAAKDADGGSPRAEEPTSSAEQDDAAQQRDVGEHRSSERKHGTTGNRPRNTRPGRIPGGEKSTDKPVETSAVDDAERSHDQPEDRRSPEGRGGEPGA